MDTRYIPGPAGQYQYHAQESFHSTNKSKHNTITNTNNTSKDDDKNINDHHPVINRRDPFHSRSWLAMCNSLGFPYDRTTVNIDRKHVLGITILDISDGTYDLKVPRMIGYVFTLLPTDSNDWLIELSDITGTMNGFISPKHLHILTERGMQLRPGCTLLLENVSIFISKQPFLRRFLNIHSDCVIAVWN